jgi:EAL domain-containing protein (putative c-di-GMP-specific phosphodiesterase class I)
VRDAGCTLGQGYYFSRAVPDYQAAMLLAQERGGEQAQRKTA